MKRLNVHPITQIFIIRFFSYLKIFEVQVGPLIISYSQIFISICCSLIIAPVSFAIVKLFSSADSTNKSWRETMQDLKGIFSWKHSSKDPYNFSSPLRCFYILLITPLSFLNTICLDYKRRNMVNVSTQAETEMELVYDDDAEILSEPVVIEKPR